MKFSKLLLTGFIKYLELSLCLEYLQIQYYPDISIANSSDFSVTFPHIAYNRSFCKVCKEQGISEDKILFISYKNYAEGFQLIDFLNDGRSADSILAIYFSTIEKLTLHNNFMQFPNLKLVGFFQINKVKNIEEIGLFEFPESFSMLDFRSVRNLEFFDDFSNLKKITYLSISDCDLRSLPDDLNQFEKLEILIINENKNFQELPECIGDIKTLKHLEISCTCLNDLPKGFGKLINLKNLILPCNSFKVFPRFLAASIDLDVLDFEENEISLFSDEIKTIQETDIENELLYNEFINQGIIEMIVEKRSSEIKKGFFKSSEMSQSPEDQKIFIRLAVENEIKSSIEGGLYLPMNLKYVNLSSNLLNSEFFLKAIKYFGSLEILIMGGATASEITKEFLSLKSLHTVDLELFDGYDDEEDEDNYENLLFKFEEAGFEKTGESGRLLFKRKLIFEKEQEALIQEDN